MGIKEKALILPALYIINKNNYLFCERNKNHGKNIAFSKSTYSF